MTEKNVLKSILLPLLETEYNIPKNLNEKNLYEIRKYILSTKTAAANNNNNKQCYTCQKYNKNLKLRQIQNNSRLSDEIIFCQFICDECFHLQVSRFGKI